MDRLRFYHVREDYIEFLHKMDNRVQHNKGQRRPYVGIVLKIGSFDYYVPLESPKPNHVNLKSGGPVLKLDGGALGIMGFNNMIPVHKHQLLNFDILAEPDERYRALLLKQLDYCEKNRALIFARAQKTYEKAVAGNNPFYQKVCCNFKRLEACCGKYRAKNTTSV
ncbi:MAG: type III toxin-antitoxin system ToxN/AbiQ family toxin [Lawsonibacter sp.]|nr:type III toxin-antitoxin system ToxN/AbiQ family toxin [Lawsonibacter sp.]